MTNDSQHDQPSPTYLSTEQAAQQMGVTVELVRNLCDEGVLIGAQQDHATGPWRIPAATVDEWQRCFALTTPDPWVAIWGVLTFLFGMIFLYSFFSIWYRLASPDPEFLAFSAAVIQILSIVSLLGLGTDWGKHATSTAWEFITHSYDRRDYPRLGAIWMARLAALALFILVFGLPVVAWGTNAVGLTASENGQYSVAIKRFKEAVSAAPTNARYYYNLGRAYEASSAYDEAIAAYRRSLDFDDTVWPIYNQLGLLYLLHQQDADATLKLLSAGLWQVEHGSAQSGLTETDVLFATGVLHKNLGQTYLVMELPQTAQQELDQANQHLNAYAKQPDKKGDVWLYLAEIHRLLALTYASMQDIEQAKRSWGTMEGFALAFTDSLYCQTHSSLTNADCFLAQKWLAEAKEQNLE